jgi:hypothetical protein
MSYDDGRELQDLVRNGGSEDEFKASFKLRAPLVVEYFKNSVSGSEVFDGVVASPKL